MLSPGAKTSRVTLSERNLRASKAPYWAGAWATEAAPTSGTYYVEMTGSWPSHTSAGTMWCSDTRLIDEITLNTASVT